MYHGNEVVLLAPGVSVGHWLYTMGELDASWAVKNM
jgi:hypothetical protein